jgi:hypothetical protein
VGRETEGGLAPLLLVRPDALRGDLFHPVLQPERGAEMHGLGILAVPYEG